MSDGRLKPCAKCKHYFVTWDQLTPNGCRIYNIQSKRLPCLVVFESSGQPCQAFELKDRLKKTPSPYGDD